jgi:hypothetical protein
LQTRLASLLPLQQLDWEPCSDPPAATQQVPPPEGQSSPEQQSEAVAQVPLSAMQLLVVPDELLELVDVVEVPPQIPELVSQTLLQQSMFCAQPVAPSAKQAAQTGEEAVVSQRRPWAAQQSEDMPQESPAMPQLADVEPELLLLVPVSAQRPCEQDAEQHSESTLQVVPDPRQLAVVVPLLVPGG